MASMDMFEGMEKSGPVLCGASAYEEKYYFNPAFSRLPEDIQKELRIICVLFVEENSGTFLMQFNEDHELILRTEAKDSDYNYDEIGAELTIKEIRKNRMELMEQLELFYKVIILGIPIEEA